MGYDGPMTHRQFLCWQEWLNWHLPNLPSRDNYYQMQIAAEIRRNVSKTPRKIKTEDFKITFRKKGEEDTLTPEQQKNKTEYIKQAWLARMTAKVSIRQDGKEIDQFIPAAMRQRELKKKQAEERNKARAQNLKKQPQIPPTGNDNGRRGNSETNGGRILLPRNARKSRGSNTGKG